MGMMSEEQLLLENEYLSLRYTESSSLIPDNELSLQRLKVQRWVPAQMLENYDHTVHCLRQLPQLVPCCRLSGCGLILPLLFLAPLCGIFFLRYNLTKANL